MKLHLLAINFYGGPTGFLVIGDRLLIQPTINFVIAAADEVK